MESENQLVSRYLDGLNENIDDEIGCQTFFDLTEAQNLATKVEMRLSMKKKLRNVLSYLYVEGLVESPDKVKSRPILEPLRGGYRANKGSMVEPKEVPKCQPTNPIPLQRNIQANNP